MYRKIIKGFWGLDNLYTNSSDWSNLTSQWANNATQMQDQLDQLGIQSSPVESQQNSTDNLYAALNNGFTNYYNTKVNQKFEQDLSDMYTRAVSDPDYQNRQEDALRKAERKQRAENRKEFLSKTAPIFEAVGNAFRPTDSADPTAMAIGQGIGDGLSMLGPGAKIAVAVGRVMDKVVGKEGWSVVNRDSAKRAGYNAALENIGASVPGAKMLGLFMNKSDEAMNFSRNYAKMGDFSRTRKDLMAAQDLSGTKTFHTGKNNSFIGGANRDGMYTDKLLSFNDKRMHNNVSTSIGLKNMNTLSGNSGTFNVKHGGKIQELEEARNILSTLLSSKVEKHQNGGTLWDKNIIPSGALHRELSHIEEANPELEGQITKKGIPVVSLDDGGEVRQQIAEVEREELTFSKSSSYTLESFYEKYKNASEEEKKEIEIETGKWITDQILHNTQDNTGIIKEIKI